MDCKKNDIVAQREFLEKNIKRLNEVLSMKLGIKVHLQLEEKKDWCGRVYYNLYDHTNLRELCGVAKFAFKEITIGTWGIYWNDGYVVLSFNYFYTHPMGGRNAAELCSVLIENDEITIIK